MSPDLERLLDAYEYPAPRSPLGLTTAGAAAVVNFVFSIEDIDQIQSEIEGATGDASDVIHACKIDLHMVRQMRAGEPETGGHIALATAVEQVAGEKQITPMIRCARRGGHRLIVL